MEEIRKAPAIPKRPGLDKAGPEHSGSFPQQCRKEKIFLTIYLMSGVKLSGRIKSFDKYSVILETNNQEQLIFKHAISTVVVSRPMYGAPPPVHGAAPVAAGAPPVTASAGEGSED